MVEVKYFAKKKEGKMLKEMAVCIVILISIFTFDFKTQEYTEKTIEDTTSKLETLREELTKEDKDNEKLLKDMEKIYNEWLDDPVGSHRARQECRRGAYA